MANEPSQKVQIALLQKEVHDLKTDVKEMKQMIQGLVDAWTTASGLVKFVKIFSTVALTCSLMWFLGIDVIKRFFE